jgi:hypothetical protein
MGVIGKQNELVKRYIQYLIDKKRKGHDIFLIQIKSIISGRLKLIRDPDYKYLNEAQTIEITDELRQKEIESLKEGISI